MRCSHLVLPLALALSAAACASAPRVRPVKGADVDTGANSVESVRRQLKGTWELTALDVFSPTGEKTSVQASGRLQYDEFGNLSMQGTVSGTPNIDSSVLNITGRVTIDPVTRTFRFQDVAARTPDDKRVDPQLDARHVRYYELTPDQLTTTVKSTSGVTTATATWKRIQ